MNLKPRIKVAFASGTDELNRRLVERMREILARSPLKQDEGDEWVRIGGVKLLVDGGFEGGRMTKPFIGDIGSGFDRLRLSQAAAAQQIKRAVVGNSKQPGSKLWHFLDVPDR